MTLLDVRNRRWQLPILLVAVLLVATSTAAFTVGHNTSPVPSHEAAFRARDRFRNQAIPDVTPGIQAAMSNKALEFAAKSVMPIIHDGLHMTLLPDMSGEADGHIYNLTDITVRRLRADDIELAFTNDGDGGLRGALKNVSIVMSFNWATPSEHEKPRRFYRRHRLSAPPVAYVQGEGSVSLVANRIGNDDEPDSDGNNSSDDDGSCPNRRPDADDDDDCHCGGVRAHRRLRNSGTGTAIFTGAILKSVVHMGVQGEDLHLKPAINFTSASLEYDRPEIRIDGSSAPQWLSRALVDAFSKDGKKALAEAILARCRKVAVHVNRAIAKRMKTRIHCPVIGDYDMAFVRVPAPVRYFDKGIVDKKGNRVSAIAIALNGEMYTKGNADKPNPSDGRVPRDSLDVAKAFKPSGRMFDACLSLFSLNSILHASCQAGGLNIILNRKTVPPEFKFPWNTNQWVPIIPQLPMVFPNAEVEIEVASASPTENRLDEPRFHITDASMLERLLSRRITCVDSMGTHDNLENMSAEDITPWRSTLLSERTSFSPFIREIRRLNPRSPSIVPPITRHLPKLPAFSTPQWQDRKGALALDVPLLIKIYVRPSIGPERGKRVPALILRSDITSSLTIDVKNHNRGRSVLATPLRRSMSSEYATTIDNLAHPGVSDCVMGRRTPPVVSNASPANNRAVSGSHRARIAEEELRRIRDTRRRRIPREEMVRHARARLPVLPHLSINGSRPGYYRSSTIRITVPRHGTPRATSSPLIHVSSRLNVTHRRIRRIRENIFDMEPNLVDGPEVPVRSVNTYSAVNAASNVHSLANNRPSRMRMRRRVANIRGNRTSITSLSRARDGLDGHITRDRAVFLRADAIGATDRNGRGALGTRSLAGAVRASTRANVVLPDGTVLRTSAARTSGGLRRFSAVHDPSGRLTLTRDDNVVVLDDYEVDLERGAVFPFPVSEPAVVAPQPIRPPVPVPIPTVASQPTVHPVNMAPPSQPHMRPPVPPVRNVPIHPGSHRYNAPRHRPNLHAPLPLGLPAPGTVAPPVAPRRPCPCAENVKDHEDVTRIYPRIDKSRVTFAVVASRIGKFDPTRLNRLAGAFLDLVLVPTLNQKFDQGFPLYCPAGYLVENAVVEFKNNAINVAADISYRRPVALLRELRYAFRVVRARELIHQAVRRLRARRARRRGGPLVGC